MELTWEGWITLGVILIATVTLIRNWAPPDIVMLSGSVFLGVVGVLDTQEVFAGFTSQGVLTIGSLFVVAAAVRETGVLDSVGRSLLGRSHTERGALVRLAVTIVPLSAFMNNTPVVAMAAPLVTSWCRKNGVSPSRMLIPVSYLAILGGTCTLIGTSTILVVNDLIQQAQVEYRALAESAGAQATAFAKAADALNPLGMFEVTWLGLPFALTGVIYLYFVARRLLPKRENILERHGENARAYTIDMQIQRACRLIGQSVEEAGLRHLPGLFLIEIEREGKAITPVRPDEHLEAEDILTFTGVVHTIVDLERIDGLVPVADANYEKRMSLRRETSLSEAVISSSSPLIGKTVRDADFRALYNAAIVAVHRGGQRLSGRVGDIVLQGGDTLLLQAGPHFVRAHRDNRDFYLVSGVEESRSVRRDKALLALGFLGLLVVLMTTGWVDIPIAAALTAALMVGTQCISPATARESVDWRTLLTIGGAIALGTALAKSGAATELASALVNVTEGMGPLWLLALIYVLTSIFTECVTTQAAAVLMFPIAVATAITLDLSPRPFAMAVLFASAASLVTPLGYQTNMMVFGPGGYKYSDYIRVGLPLYLVLTTLAMLLIPLIWPFS